MPFIKNNNMVELVKLCPENNWIYTIVENLRVGHIVAAIINSLYTPSEGFAESLYTPMGNIQNREGRL